MKHPVLCYFLVLLFTACHSGDTKKAEKADKGSALDSNVIGIPVNSVEMEDDSVFADGSRPTSWQNAGITKVTALKVFIKDLQYMAANDNSEEISKLVNYPLNKNIKTKGDFLAAYEQLFNARVKQDLERVNPRQIFRNYQGVMIGNGTIWIRQFDNDFKIIAINN